MTKHSPTPEERDQRVSVPFAPDELIEAVLQAGPHPDEDAAAEDEERDRLIYARRMK